MSGFYALNIITFLAAFLLFQIELIIAKIFLPHYGGSYLVWGSCVVFFQAVLLLGYVFAHALIQKLRMRRYRLVHLVLMLLPLLFFPGRPLAAGPMEEYALPLALDVFLRLCKTIGPAFFVLSTVSVTTQMWLATSNLTRKSSPYALYAVSNLGSFLALLSYPFIFEAQLDLSQQLGFWRIAYLILIALNIWAWLGIQVKEIPDAAAKHSGETIKLSQKVYWFLLGMAGVVVFLATNNIITNEIAPVPLLWIMPLGLYLLSFVFNFREKAWCPSWIVRRIEFVLGLAAVLFFLVEQKVFPIPVSLVLLCGTQFILCLYCQNRLIALRPHDDRQLTLFYVIFSLGGFLGGVLTTWIIPLVSHSIVEYLVGLILIAVTLVIGKEWGRSYLRLRHILWIILLAIAVWVWPVLFTRYNVWGLLMIVMFVRFVFMFIFRRAPIAVALSLVVLLVIAYFPFNENKRVAVRRNYYGIIKVTDADGIRTLSHSETIHGAQYLAQDKRKEPLTYYSAKLPAGEILSANIFSFPRIGLIGLGTGALSAYGQAHQTLDFYELDPDMYFIAREHFTYLKDSPAKINFILGDARQSLEKNHTVKYDLLVVDAFGGDSIPFHLLTEEGISLYRDRLNEGGMLLFHISNRYLDLKNVLARAGMSLNAHVGFKVSQETSFVDIISTWVVMTWDDDSFATLRSKLGWSEADLTAARATRLWTDRYINILPTIKLRQFLESIKSFTPFNW